MNENKEIIKLFISSMFAFAIMFVVSINQRVSINNVEEVTTIKEPKPVFEEFEATAYCACPKCCGKWADGITASGTKATSKRTIAVDTSIIPLGTEVEIEGLGIYIAEDTGSAIKGKIIDFYFDTHEEALKFGRQKVNLRIVSSIDGGN